MLHERTGVPTAKIMAQIETARQKGLLETDPTVFPPDRAGTVVFKRFVTVFFMKKPGREKLKNRQILGGFVFNIHAV